jgi:hypothetical protein
MLAEIFFLLPDFFLLPENLCDNYEGDPLSPPKGEATQGEHPLDPHFRCIFHQPCERLSHSGGCPSGGGSKHDVLETPGAIF